MSLFVIDGDIILNPRYCLDLLREFNRAHNIVVKKPQIPEQDKQSGGRANYHNPSNQPIGLSQNLVRLEDLLDINRLNNELQDLMDTRKLFKTKAYFNNSDTNMMISAWNHHNHIHSMLGSYITVLPDEHCSVAGIMLYRLLHAVQILPSLVSDSRKLAVILSVQHWEMCRSMMVIFNWYNEAGPATAEHLFDTYRIKGYNWLKIQSPLLVDLVNHIIWHVYEEKKAWLKNRKERKSKKRHKRTGIDDLNDNQQQEEIPEECSNFGPRPSNLRELPQNLYGLCPNKTTKRPIKLHQLTSFRTGGLDEIYAKSKDILQQVWTTELIMPSLIPIDTTFTSARRNTTSDKDVLDRCLTRGAILQCLADACGTDAIFASTGIKAFLASPALIFEQRLQREKHFAQHALSNAVLTLQPLFDWLKSHIEERPDIPRIAQQIGDLIHLSMLELDAGQPLSVEETQSTTQSTLPNTTTTVAPKTVRRKQTHIFSEVSPASLLPHRTTVGIGVLGLIVREALAADRGLHTAKEILRRVLEGKHATQSSASSHNPDHTNPIRQYSLGAQLLYCHLPGVKLTSEAGLSNLLSWLGTGQGFATQSFLNTVLDRGGFYAEDVSAMVDQFEKAISTNCYYFNLHTIENTKSRLPKIPELVVTHDIHIWGQASNHLALFPTYTSGAKRGSKYTLQDKFNQYFTSVVQEQWIKALGDMLNKDPSTYTGPRRSWRYYHDMVKKLNIPGFQQGLTVFQLTNYLVFLGIATMPHWSEIADFISENRQKGAFRSLEKLGFRLTDLSSVHAAFYCIHQHLDQYLTADDKGVLGFSPIFTEHLLCKIVRWAKHLTKEGNIDFYQEGHHAESTCNWEAGLNKTDNMAFPFPLIITGEQLANGIKAATVSISITLQVFKRLSQT